MIRYLQWFQFVLTKLKFLLGYKACISDNGSSAKQNLFEKSGGAESAVSALWLVV